MTDIAPTTSPAARNQNAKLQRWVDLLAALLRRRMPATFEQLAAEVPEYWRTLEEARSRPTDAERKTGVDSLKRTFERDKLDLRSFGVPIESVPDVSGDNAEGAYRLKTRDFYLPYLGVEDADGTVIRGTKVDREGYRALSTLVLDHDELTAIVHAAALARSLGNPLLAADIDSALRKLAIDLPVGAVADDGEPKLLLPRARPSNKTFAELSDALHKRKRVSFDYHALSTNETERREVEPYGLFFLNGHWYLAARDCNRGAGDDGMRDGLRNFRLNRIQSAKTNASAPGTPDFDVPATFRLREHSASRHAWELGDNDAITVEVAVRGSSGPAVAAAKLGRPVVQHGEALDGNPDGSTIDTRSFNVRRTDSFARWLLSSAGALIPLDPPAFVAEFNGLLNAVAARYTTDGRAALERVDAPDASPALPPATRRKAPADAADSVEVWKPQGAAAQLRRVLQLMPSIADGEDHGLAEIAAALGVDVGTVHDDLFSLVDRYDMPGAFVEGIQLSLDADSVSAMSSHLLRPMRLTAGELWALLLGLSALRASRTPAEHTVIEQAQGKLREIVALLPPEDMQPGMLSSSSSGAGDASTLATVKRGIVQEHKLSLVYRKSNQEAPDTRVICPYAIVLHNGMLYLFAHCEREGAVRVFRFDRIEAVSSLDEPFERPADFSAFDSIEGKRMFQRRPVAGMRVYYSPHIARWIAEREGRPVRADGSLILEHPLGDAEWGLRHVLQYGADAEVLEPVEMRELLVERVRGMRVG